MQKPTLQTILISVLVIVALFTSIYFPYKWKQLSNDFLDQTSQYGELLNQINDLQREVRELKNGDGEVEEFGDWKTYRNEEYGFEAKYPDNVSIEEIGIVGKPANEKSKDIVFIIQNPEYFKTDLASNLKLEILSLTLQESDLLFSEFVSQVAKDFAKKETFKIDNKEAVKLTFIKGSIKISSYSFLAENIDVIFMKHNQNMFMITLFSIEKDKAMSETIFNQMLSTFKFIE